MQKFAISAAALGMVMLAGTVAASAQRYTGPAPGFAYGAQMPGGGVDSYASAPPVGLIPPPPGGGGGGSFSAGNGFGGEDTATNGLAAFRGVQSNPSSGGGGAGGGGGGGGR